MTIDSDIKEEERNAINELQKRMKDDMNPELYDDIYLFLRFLRARDLNVDNAEKMLRKHLEWRKKYEIDNVLEFKKTEVMEKYIPNPFLGFDKEGCLIRYCPAGNIDIVGCFSSCKFGDLMKFLIYEMETETIELKKQSRKLGRNVDKCIYIHNFANLTFAQATDKRTINFMIFLLNSFVSNYPERLKAAYLINISKYFSLVFSMVKPMLPNTVLNKFFLYSDDSYKEDLLKVIDADVLPKFLGGNRTDPDGNPLCLTFINHGEPVPRSYYIEKGKRTLANAPGVEKVILSNAAFHEVKLEVNEAGSYLEWEFETKCRDIGFGLFYEEVIDGAEKITELVPIERIDTEEYPETGTIGCKKAGKYVIVFDNTYSWVRAKEIYYRIKIVTPEEHEAQMVK